jgi:4-carboxymuconolactone decarboxylase
MSGRIGRTIVRKALLIVAAATSIAFPAMAQERLSPIKPETYDAAQKKAAAEFEVARKAPVFARFERDTRTRPSRPTAP